MATSVPPGVDLSADRGPEIVRITVAIAVLTTIVVVLRLISRRIQKAKWNAADYTIIVALVGCWGETGAVLSSKPSALWIPMCCSMCAMSLTQFFILGIPYGLGKHVEVVGLENTIKILQVSIRSTSALQH